MKKLINAPERVVEEMLRGMGLAHPGLVRIIPEYNVVVRADAPVEGKVALVSGGGSGHEPTHGGYVGQGMLDAACAGAVFTSPTPEQMLEATKAVNGGAGVFYVVKNYTGDVLNFEMAGELSEAEGIETDYVVTNDDVAVDLHERSARDRRHRLRAQDLRCRCRGREGYRRDKGARREGKRERALDGDGPYQLHPARERRAHLRDRRGRDGDRDRHPRRTRRRA
jgi:hypothetical protein